MGKTQYKGLPPDFVDVSDVMCSDVEPPPNQSGKKLGAGGGFPQACPLLPDTAEHSRKEHWDGGILYNKYLGGNLNNKLEQIHNTTALYKKGQSRL